MQDKLESFIDKMSKLYKYLPFDIKVQEDDEVYNLEIISNKGVILADLSKYGGEEVDGTVEGYWKPLYNAKPILRPISHLTRELPLTKVAAEMIDKKEGDVIDIIRHFFPEEQYQTISMLTWKGTRTPLESLYSSFIIEEDAVFKLNINYYKNKEEFLDFLRAMYFNLDFKENEFIPLTDQYENK